MNKLQWIFITGAVLAYLAIGSQMTTEDIKTPNYCDKAPECYAVDDQGNNIN